MDNEQQKPGNYLSIDGGPSGLPALYTLEEIFNRLQDDLRLNKEPIPRRWFDIIIGTGRGAIIAILLGKLGLTVSKAIEVYMKLDPALSAKQAQNDEERAKNTEEFKRLFLEVLSEADVKEDAPMLGETETKTIICVANTVNVSVGHLIRSYSIRGTRAAPCTILEAACACIASPDRFLPVMIGGGHKKMSLFNAVAGYANPTKELLKEAQKVFGEDGEVATVFSIGAGKWGVQATTGRGRGVDLDEALRRGVIGSEQVHQDLQDRLLQTTIYFRFNVEQELDNESDIILTYTSAYLGDAVTSSRLDEAIRRIQARPFGTKLKDINSVTAVEIKLKPRPRLVPHFIGRDDILDAMRDSHFNKHQAQQSPVITILSGIGGLGKTQTALKFALEFEERYPGILVCFLDASTAEKLQTDLETVIRSRGTAYHTKSYEDALLWLATELENWLIIFDNADDPSMVPVRYIPQCAHGHVIITTRNATLAALAPNTSHALEALSTPDAITLLLTASNYPNEEDNRSLAEKIVLELGSLPLALAHAAGYIFVHRCLGTYLDMYHENREKILASTNSRLLHDYRSSVAMTIEMSFEKLSERAQDILRLFSHLQVTSIPLSMVVKAAVRRFRRVERTEESSLQLETLHQADELMKIFCPGGKWSEFTFNETIQECFQYPLLQLTTQNDDKFYSMHVLVQSHLQSVTLTRNHRPKRLISRLLGSAATIGYSSHEFLAFNRLLLPHIRLLQIEDVTEAGDHYSLGYVVHEVGDIRLALAHREKCVDIWSRLLGKENPCTIAAMEYLATSYTGVGNSQRALELDEEVLSLRKRLLGPEHPRTVRAMSNLAISYANVGRHHVGLKMDEEVLSLRRRLLGPEHPDTVTTMGNLAFSYSRVGRYQAALKMDEEVLSLRKRLLGPEHPSTMQAMCALAISYTKFGKNQAALELEEQVLLLQRRLLGPEHPDTMLAMGNLAISYKNAGKTQAALELQEEVLPLQKKLWGLQHPDILMAMRVLLNTYQELDMRAQRQNLLKITIPAHETAELFGVDHPKTVQLRNDLNELLAHPASRNNC